MSTNRLNTLPDDMLWEIYRRLHKSYMTEMIFKDEIYEGALEMYWKQTEGMGDDFDEWEEEMTSDEPDTDSEYSFTESD